MNVPLAAATGPALSAQRPAVHGPAVEGARQSFSSLLEAQSSAGDPGAPAGDAMANATSAGSGQTPRKTERPRPGSEEHKQLLATAAVPAPSLPAAALPALPMSPSGDASPAALSLTPGGAVPGAAAGEAIAPQVRGASADRSSLPLAQGRVPTELAAFDPLPAPASGAPQPAGNSEKNDGVAQTPARGPAGGSAPLSTKPVPVPDNVQPQVSPESVPLELVSRADLGTPQEKTAPDTAQASTQSTSRAAGRSSTGRTRPASSPSAVAGDHVRPELLPRHPAPLSSSADVKDGSSSSSKGSSHDANKQTSSGENADGPAGSFDAGTDLSLPAPTTAASPLGSPVSLSAVPPSPPVPIHPQPAPSRLAPDGAISPGAPDEVNSTAPLARVQSASLLRSISGSELRVGVRLEDLGNVTVRAALGREQISAHISAESERVSSALATHLSSMQNALSESVGKGLHLRTVVSVGAESSPGTRGDSAGGQGAPAQGSGSGGHSSPRQNRHDASAPTSRIASTAANPQRYAQDALPERLSIRI